MKGLGYQTEDFGFCPEGSKKQLKNFKQETVRSRTELYGTHSRSSVENELEETRVIVEENFGDAISIVQ